MLSSSSIIGIRRRRLGGYGPSNTSRCRAWAVPTTAIRTMTVKETMLKVKRMAI